MPWLALYIALAWVIRITMVGVLLRRQFTPGASIAWMGIVFLHPFIGLGLYLLVGESRLGPGRVARHRELTARYRGAAGSRPACSRDVVSDPACAPIVLQARKISGMPVLGGNRVEFVTDSEQMISRLVSDIESARSHIHLLYYMIAPDETGRRVGDALASAARRGVSCRVLADAFASRSFLRRDGLAAQLAREGVQVAAALPTAPFRRRDLRNHRKLAVIDDQIAYAGSENLINADYGGRRGAPWRDLTGRLTGPVVGELAVVFAEDWAFETGQLLDVPDPHGIAADEPGVAMQVVPTGPISPSETYRRVLLGAVQSAARRLILTSPYFVPDQPTLVALMMAADRGVEVSLILPARPDHIFTAAAGRANFSALLEAGVRIFQYRPGLIHAKTATVDDSFALFGSANLDVRSFNLNFELSVLAYGREVTQQLRAIQMQYLAESTPIDMGAWSRRLLIARYADSAVSLLSPLL